MAETHCRDLPQLREVVSANPIYSHYPDSPSSSHSLARSTSNRSRVHWRISSCFISSISSESVSSSSSKREGSNGSVSRVVSRY